MIAPLSTERRAKGAKCPIKFLEITAAGAVGVYSDVEPYRPVIHGVSGIKCNNTIEAWTEAIVAAASLLPSERRRMVGQAIQTIKRRYTSEAQAPRVAATLVAGMLHGILRRERSEKPRIAYFCHSAHLAGAEEPLRHARLALSFQFEPVLVLPSCVSGLVDEMQRRAMELKISLAYLPLTAETEANPSRKLDEGAIAQIQSWLSQNRIALAHSVTLMREVGEAAQRLGIPHVASLYATASQAPAGFHHCDVIHSDSFFAANQWGDVLDAPVRRIMSHVPEEYFEMGDSADSGAASRFRRRVDSRDFRELAAAEGAVRRSRGGRPT